MDIAQRTKLIQVSTRQATSRQEVLEELIDEKLKLHDRQALQARDQRHRGGCRLQQHRHPRRQQSAAVSAGAAAGRESSPERSRTASAPTWAGRRSSAASSVATSRSASETSSTRLAVAAERRTSRRSVTSTRCGRSSSSSRAARAENVIAARQARGGRPAHAVPELRGRHPAGARTEGRRGARCRSPHLRPTSRPQLREILEKTAGRPADAARNDPQGIEIYAICGKRQTTSEMPGKREVRER